MALHSINCYNLPHILQRFFCRNFSRKLVKFVENYCLLQETYQGSDRLAAARRSAIHSVDRAISCRTPSGRRSFLQTNHSCFPGHNSVVAALPT